LNLHESCSDGGRADQPPVERALRPFLAPLEGRIIFVTAIEDGMSTLVVAVAVPEADNPKKKASMYINSTGAW